MKIQSSVKGKTRGSSLLAVMFVVIVLSTGIAALLKYTSNTHRNSSRQEIYDQARLIADSEMEYLYYLWKQQALLGTGGDATISALNSAGYLVTDADPFSAKTKAQGLLIAPATGGWKVTRAMSFVRIPGRPDGGASGQVPGTQKLGHNFYFETKVSVKIQHAVFGLMDYRAARRFVQTETSLFQNAIYYQDDLEIAALGQLVVNGDITCNGDVYLGAQPTSPTNDLTIYGKAKIFGTFNGIAIDGSGAIGTVMRKPGSLGSSVLHDPIFDPSAGLSPPSDQVATRVTQVQKLEVPENVLGGVDAESVIHGTYFRAYRDDPTDLSIPDFAIDPPNSLPKANNVYRSVIAPPPVEADLITLVPEDPVIASRRMYSRAGIVITLSANTTTPTLTDLHVGSAGTSTTSFDGSMQADFNLVIPAAERRQTITDQREHALVYVTNVDVGILIAKIASNSALAAEFNGVIYIHDTTPGPTLRAIRIKNATATPIVNDSVTAQPKGFTLVSNNGIYIEGDFNTTAVTTGHYNPCAIMGDAITVLSGPFNLSKSNLPLTSRISSASIVINSALISGNTPSATGTTSGGVQNLVRYMEDWTAGGHSATFHGSLSQLFKSTQFSSNYVPNGPAGNVYTNPTPRVFDFDPDLADTPPALSPKSSAYFRGEHYTY